MSMAAHPLSLLSTYTRLAAQNYVRPFQFEFSKYVYVPQAVVETRKHFQVSPAQFEEVFETQRKSLLINEEIAFHSRLLFEGGEVAHIPMLDMGCAQIEDHLSKLQEAFHDFGIDRITVFHSGRSFHIYGHALLKGDHELVRFMGRMLLLNLPQQERVVDERWVGHRLMAAYLTLRWTDNNPYYKSAPVQYGEYSYFESSSR